MQKCAPEPANVEAAVAELVDVPSFTTLLAKWARHRVENNSLDKARMEQRFVKLAKEVGNENKVEDGSQTKRLKQPDTQHPDGHF